MKLYTYHNQCCHDLFFEDDSKNLIDCVKKALAKRGHLRGIDLSYKWTMNDNLRGINLKGADLTGAIFKYSDLTEANLSFCNLRHVDMRYTKLSGANLYGATMDYMEMEETTLKDADLRETIYHKVGLTAMGQYSHKHR